MDPTPEAEARKEELTDRATELVAGLARHGIRARIDVQVLDNQQVRAMVRFDSEGWLSLADMLLAFLDTRAEKLREMPKEKVLVVPLVPGPEGVQ